jgi:type VI secretion system protein
VFQERTLLERLRKPAQGPQTMHEDAGALMRSILRNMNRILNSRAGQFPAQPDYGIPSPSEIAHAYPDSVKVVQRRMRECIEKYEPRLKDVQVTQIESDEQKLALRFQIAARLATTTEQRQVKFDTVIEASGHIEMA